MQVVLLWVVTAYGVPERLRYVFAPYLFCSPYPPTFFSTPGFLVCNRFLYKPFSKTVLWVVRNQPLYG